MTIEPIYVDENGGATKQVQELRNLYDREQGRCQWWVTWVLVTVWQ
jgi:hypothetical protein